mmetsp:Transcript_86066/g.251812  ORF Transcript_86066/g.251812 Transcript_86066/m.251812 type:complete len:226 (+) Transcript_86066:238-915(+)
MYPMCARAADPICRRHEPEIHRKKPRANVGAAASGCWQARRLHVPCSTPAFRFQASPDCNDASDVTNGICGLDGLATGIRSVRPPRSSLKLTETGCSCLKWLPRAGCSTGSAALGLCQGCAALPARHLWIVRSSCTACNSPTARLPVLNSAPCISVGPRPELPAWASRAGESLIVAAPVICALLTLPSTQEQLSLRSHGWDVCSAVSALAHFSSSRTTRDFKSSN